MMRMSSATSVPDPRTSRSMGPRLTVSISAVERSSEGDAGRSRETPKVMMEMAKRPTTL